MLIKKILLPVIICTIPIASVYADVATNMQKCINENRNYITGLLNSRTANIVQITEETKKAIRGYAVEAFAQTVLEKCYTQIPNFLDEADKTVTMTYGSSHEDEGGNDLIFNIEDVYVKNILNSIATPVGIVFWPKGFSISDDLIVTKDKAKKIGTVNDRCSAPNPGWNVGNDTVINKAGQSVFNQNNEEYFIDNDPYAFTGLLMEDVYGTSENRVMYLANILDAYKKAKNMVEYINKNKSGICTGLNAYIVGLYVEKNHIEQHIEKNNEYSGGDGTQYYLPIAGSGVGTLVGGYAGTAAGAKLLVGIGTWMAAHGIISGAAAGATTGAAGGATAAPATFGTSILFGALIGAAIGAATGLLTNKVFTWDVSANIGSVAVLSHAIPVR